MVVVRLASVGAAMVRSWRRRGVRGMVGMEGCAGLWSSLVRERLGTAVVLSLDKEIGGFIVPGQMEVNDIA